MRLWRLVRSGARMSGTFSLGHHVALVFTRVDGNMGYYLFTNLHIKNSHGIVTHWNLRHSASWVPGRCSTGYRTLWGSITGSGLGRGAGLGSSLSDPFGRLPACSPPARLSGGPGPA